MQYLVRFFCVCALWLLTFGTQAATLSTRYTYDEAGNKTSQTDALGHVTQWTYSVLNHITSRTLPDGSRESFAYDSTGQLISHTDFNNQTTRYGYDALNRLILTQYPDGHSVKNTYNTNQQLDTVTESQILNGKIVNQVTKYNYDINDRLVKVTYPNNQSISYSYDAVGNLLTRSTVNGTTKYSYDLNDRLATVTDSQGGLTRFSYDAVGNKTERILANGIKTSWQYNSRNQLTGLSHRQADGTLIAEYQYTLDAKGNRTAITETLVNEQGQSHQRQLAYSYDNVDRLTSETVTDNDNAFGGSYSRTYQYDSVGNRSQQIHTANNQSITTTYSYDVNDQLQSETTGEVQTNYRYDKNGNLLEKSTAQGVLAQYRYNTQNQLTEVVLPQVSYRYAYDSQGNRIQSQQLKNGQAETTYYLVDTNFNYAEVIEEKDGQGQLLASQTFTPENTGDLLSITNASKENRYTLEDGLGSLRQITNTLGQVQGSQTTTAWGESLSNTTKTYTDYGYTGEKQNAETGLVYLRAREYMPSVGRFVQRDTWTGIPTKPVTLNQFVYADANGVNRKDPSGRTTLNDQMTALAIQGQVFMMRYPTTTFASALVFQASFAEILPPIPIAPANPYEILSSVGHLAQTEKMLKSSFWLNKFAAGNAFEKWVIGILKLKKNTIGSCNGNPTNQAGCHIIDVVSSAHGLVEIKTSAGAIGKAQFQEFIVLAMKKGMPLTYVFFRKPSPADLNKLSNWAKEVMSPSDIISFRIAYVLD